MSTKTKNKIMVISLIRGYSTINVQIVKCNRKNVITAYKKRRKIEE
jgi:hypothetical protein